MTSAGNGPGATLGATDESGCTHERRERRRRTLSNGVVTVTDQCIRCGNAGPAVKKALVPNVGALPPFDDGLAGRFWDRQKEFYAQSARSWKRKTAGATRNGGSYTAPTSTWTTRPG